MALDRINYNVPRAMVGDVRAIASNKGQEVAYWLRKVLEAAIQQEKENNRGLS